MKEQYIPTPEEFKKAEEMADDVLLRQKSSQDQPTISENWRGKDQIELLGNKTDELNGLMGELRGYETNYAEIIGSMKTVAREIKDIFNSLLSTNKAEESELVNIYKKICGASGCYGAMRYVSGIEALQEYDQMIGEIEFLLEKKVEIPKFSDEQRDSIIKKSLFIIKPEPFLTHVTESEMLPWIWNKNIHAVGSHHEKDSTDFGKKYSVHYWFGGAAAEFRKNKSKIQSDEHLRHLIQEYVKNMKLSIDASGAGQNARTTNRLLFVKIIAKNDDRKKKTEIKKVAESDDYSMHISQKEFLELKEGGFLEKGDAKFNENETNIFANMLSHCGDFPRKSYGTTDIACWIEARGLEMGRMRSNNDPYAISRGRVGAEFIKAIQCATPYAVEKVLNFLKLHCYDDAEKYIPVFDHEGNLVWPEKLTLDELKSKLRLQEE
ncbi:MAG: hypothetical protein WCV59_04770 [Parcubacteria group bacterium]|jgi:hypothetical protein